MKRPKLAISIKQPFAEAILSGRKTTEIRSRPTTKLHERVYIYASLRPREPREFRRFKVAEDAVRGMIVGTVEITHCTRRGDDWHWHLKNPKRLRVPLKPKRHPNPVWFHPF